MGRILPEGANRFLQNIKKIEFTYKLHLRVFSVESSRFFIADLLKVRS